jgi:alpha-mannosidase
MILYNPVAWERNSRVFIPISVFKNLPKLDASGKPNYAKIKLLNGEDNEFICQPIAAEPKDTIDSMTTGWWTVIKLKSLSFTPIKITILTDSESVEIGKQSNFNVSTDSVSNGKISVKLDPNTGAILKLTADNINNGNNLLKGNFSNLTFGFIDRGGPLVHAWNLTAQYWKYPLELSNEKDVNIKISEFGPVFTTLEITRTLGISQVVQKITLFNDYSEVFLEYLADWKQKDIMLKVLYSTTTEAKIATADIAYGAINFKTNPNVPCDKARYEKICHKYFDLSTPDKKWGLAIINEGKYAFDVSGGDIKLTMLRVCKYPLPAEEAWVNVERMENEKKYQHKVPEYSGLGPFKCRYAILPHNGGTLINTDGTPNVIIKRRAEEFNMPVIVVPTGGIQANREKIAKLGKSFLEILTPNVYLGALKMNEWKKTGTIIVRFFEGSGLSVAAKIKFNSELAERVSSIRAVDLLEREIKYKYEWNKDMGVLSFNICKFEICTFELVF